MNEVDPREFEPMLLRRDGRFAEALSLLQAWFAEIDRGSTVPRSRHFMTMLEWQMLAEEYVPARAALAALRDQQAARLLDGELYCGAGTSQDLRDILRPVARFSRVVEINRILDEPQSTHDVFLRLEAAHPDYARRQAWQALPDIVKAGGFALADRYRGDPLALLDEVNAGARSMPMFPPAGAAPRLAGELMGLTRDVQLGMDVLRGLGQPAAADALGQALLDGLESDALRALAQRELRAPGTINDELVERRMAWEQSQGRS